MDVNTVYNQFITNYNLNITSFSNSMAICGDRSKPANYTQSMHTALVEKCYMNIFMLWEKFLENVFVAYLMGETDLKGNSYSRYVNPTSDEHAYKIIKGTKNYPDWTKIEDVRLLADNYFTNAGPFSQLISSVEFTDIKTIRNKISHMSQNSDNAFKRILARETQPQTLSVGEFLLVVNSNSNETYFSKYTHYLLNFVELLCNK